MGIVASIRNNCFSQDDDQPFIEALTENSKIISQDFDYFQQENWYRVKQNLLFDPNKFIFLYRNYKADQIFLLDLWKIVDLKKLTTSSTSLNQNTCEVVSQRWKYAIRKGVPITHYKKILNMLFDKNSVREEANRKKYLEKQTKIIEKIYTFSDQGEEGFKTPFLYPSGEEALKRIASLIATNIGKLEYNPYFLTILAMLLIFMKEFEVYEIAVAMVESSANMSLARQQSLVWHLVLNSHQMDKYSHLFYKKIKKISPTINIINNHLNSEGIDKLKIYKQIIGKFFFGYLPFPVICKIFMIFMNEGYQIFYRIYYAILKMADKQIRDCSNTKQILRAIKTKMLNQLINPEDIKKFFRLAFDLRLSPVINIKKEIESLRSQKSEGIYYLPEIKGESQILSYEDLEVIWGFLSDLIKHYDLRRVYSMSQGQSGIHGYQQIISQLKKNDFSILLIQTISDNVFGVFISQKFHTIKQKSINLRSAPLDENYQQNISKSNQSSLFDLQRSNSNKNSVRKSQIPYFGSSETFIFTITPKKQKFTSTGENVFYCAYDDSNLIFGGPANRPALQLDSSLTIGLSFNCLTYNNPTLHDGPPGEFKVKNIECFKIQ